MKEAVILFTPSVLGMAVVSSIGHLLPSDFQSSALILLLLLYMWIGYYIYVTDPKNQKILSIAVMAIMPISVGIDALLDEGYWGASRNLFPIEIMIYFVILPIFIWLGIQIGKRVKKLE
jgi:hypothetical protein